MPRQGVIGLIGGMSWESSAEYYRIINQAVRDRLGGLRSARCLMWSFDFGEIEALQHAGRWEDAAALLADAARRLERGGADFFLICTNTMHRVADEVQAAVRIPLLHIADATAERDRLAGLGVDVVMDLQDEPWGQRRFQVLAPDDVVVEVVQRIDPDPGWSAG